MNTIDDPLLALILRFVGRSQQVTFRDDEFLREQLKEIREHIRGAPPEEQQARAFEWIENHAREYRGQWAQGIVDERFSGERCSDCPLAGSELAGKCLIHEQWLELLRRYIADEISARAYAEHALALLARHKENLKLSPALALGGE
jgi:hypothetical protein